MAEEWTVLPPSPHKTPSVSLSTRTKYSRTVNVVWSWGYTSQTDHFVITAAYRDQDGQLLSQEETYKDPRYRTVSFDAPRDAASVTIEVTPITLYLEEDRYVYDVNGDPLGYHPAGQEYFTTTSGQNIYTFPVFVPVDVPVSTVVSNIPDWTKSMKRTYEYYKVDPVTWLNTERVENVISSSIVRDADADTLGSASFNISADIGECYVRTYMVTTQDGHEHKTCLGTHLCQTRDVTFDGKRHDASIDGYTALNELKEQMPPIGYSILAGRNILDVVSNVVRDTIRPPITPGHGDTTIDMPFIADVDDTWFTYLNDLLIMGQYGFGLDEMGGIILVPKQDFNSLQPVWTYNDDNSSILQPNITVSRDLYGVPNVVEVVYTKDTQGTNDANNRFIYSRAVNDDPNSPSSTVNRGREIVQRINNPEIYGEPDQIQLDNYARQALRDLSSLEYTVTYTHAYCPVRLNDCVLLNYRRAGLENVKAKVIRQSITCDSGGQVEETAVYTTNLWG